MANPITPDVTDGHIAAHRSALDLQIYDPVGDGTTVDKPTIQQLLNDAAGGVAVISKKPDDAVTTYVIDLADPLTWPDNTKVIVEKGVVMLGKANSASGAGIYRMWSPTSATPVGLTMILDGILDGNVANGNHGASENIAAFHISDLTDVTIIGTGMVRNWRGDAFYCGLGVQQSKRLTIGGFTVKNVGYPVGGDANVNGRQGIVAISIDGLVVLPMIFDDISGFCIDIEPIVAGRKSNNIAVSDGIVVRGHCQGLLNVAPGAPFDIGPNVRFPRSIAGDSIDGSVCNVPAELQSRRYATRQSTDKIITASTMTVVDTALDLTIPARPGDFIEVGVCGMWGSEAKFAQLDAASMVSGAPTRWWSSGTGTGVGTGVGAWRGGSLGTTGPIGGSIRRQISSADIDANGYITLRLFAAVNVGGGQRTLYSSTGNAALQFQVENLGNLQ